ncbi:MAG: S8 family serine peptidase [Gammaproteobacteria bacterium]|nr:S8 family serine peptidase [Gammaproteobacteria bacterium]
MQKGFDPDALKTISADIEFVSQEGDEIFVAFVSDAALASFEARLASISKGEDVKYKYVLYALKGFDSWTREDRAGWALKEYGLPESQDFLLDVELWPIEDNQEENLTLCKVFDEWLKEQGIVSLDSVKQPGLTIYRVRCNTDQAELLLRNRDVRTVDLPPKFGMDIGLIVTDAQDLNEPEPPPDTAPGVVVLDSGITAGHPLLRRAVGDAQSFLDGLDSADGNGHGTHIAGLALYGDVEDAIESGSFVPELRLFSGRILDDNNENNTGLIEKQVREAVKYFNGEYGCKVFNLSVGDRNKPYTGQHLRGLAFTLDQLSREYGVLFVVSAGNVPASKLDPLDWRNNYPDYIDKDEWTLLDPATALNVLTVGSLARYDQTFASQRYSGDPAEQPIARRDQPSPFTRHGPTVNSAIKPELVAYGGNWAINTRGGANYIVTSGLGELSTNSNFANGYIFGEDSGTSFSAPHISHLAGRILTEHPEVNSNTLRSLLVANAVVPEACNTLITDSEFLLKVCGYGKVEDFSLLRSIENEVTLLAEENIPDKRHHFFEIPIPDDFLTSGRRMREINVTLAYSPVVRSTRISYKASRIDFKLVTGPNLQQVSQMFHRATKKEDYENIPELAGASIGSSKRNKGTVQSATWRFRQINANSKLRNERLFVVITRNDYPWGANISLAEEPYSLVVCFRDRENEEARLYTQIRAKLQARIRARARV